MQNIFSLRLKWKLLRHILFFNKISAWVNIFSPDEQYFPNLSYLHCYYVVSSQNPWTKIFTNSFALALLSFSSWSTRSDFVSISNTNYQFIVQLTTNPSTLSRESDNDDKSDPNLFFCLTGETNKHVLFPSYWTERNDFLHLKPSWSSNVA